MAYDASVIGSTRVDPHLFKDIRRLPEYGAEFAAVVIERRIRWLDRGKRALGRRGFVGRVGQDDAELRREQTVSLQILDRELR